MLRKTLFLLACFSLSTNLSAVSIGVSELPSEIQSCHTTGSCIVVMDSFFDVPNTSGSAAADGSVNPYRMSAFHLFNPGTNQLDVLARYNLVMPSAHRIDDTVAPFTGSVWLRVDSQYAPGVSTAQMSLYLEHVDPLPANLFPGTADGLTLDIALEQDALLGSSGYQISGCCEEPSYIQNMSVLGDFGGEALVPCLAEGCYTSARLNLLYLLFSDPDGDGILHLNTNPFDDRGLLFQVNSYNPYSGHDYTEQWLSQSYYVSAVPLPPALYFLGSGLLMLAGLGRAQKRA